MSHSMVIDARFLDPIDTTLASSYLPSIWRMQNVDNVNNKLVPELVKLQFLARDIWNCVYSLCGRIIIICFSVYT
ncbi:hypothetical protein I3760_04G102600 [Carya illinoinensis]|uniref:Uncharacterized protein n=1 Tax=Carya illinoinensis TaxID=32201 RepID=A0A922FBK1_CARIL|nr:hypothetical protein I3760_04G102600 [Carya illinoinensis]KAG6717476.1 hypothetical protein I3842_04G102100 [Carya illinoinensis]